MGGAITRLSWWLAVAGLAGSGLLLSVLAVLGTVDVVSGNLFGAPVAAATEFASAALPATILLALAWSQRQRAHIAVDIFVNLMPARAKPASALLSLIAALVFFSLLFHGALQLALDSWRIGETAVAAIRFPIYPWKFAFALGAGLGVLESLRQIVMFFVSGGQLEHIEIDEEPV